MWRLLILIAKLWFTDDRIHSVLQIIIIKNSSCQIGFSPMRHIALKRCRVHAWVPLYFVVIRKNIDINKRKEAIVKLQLKINFLLLIRLKFHGINFDRKNSAVPWKNHTARCTCFNLFNFGVFVDVVRCFWGANSRLLCKKMPVKDLSGSHTSTKMCWGHLTFFHLILVVLAPHIFRFNPYVHKVYPPKWLLLSLLFGPCDVPLGNK